MADSNKSSIIPGAILIIVIAFFLQIMFVSAENKDTPNRAVVKFAKAYFGLDNSMADQLSQESLIVDGVNVVDKYIDSVTAKAKAEGFRPFYTKNFLYHVQTNTVSKDDNSAKIKFTCEIKHPLRSFFTKESSREIHETFDLIKEDGKWKLCGDVFSLRS
ncbi:MAG: hypothetical protein KAI50_08675 [Desulfobacterales bacterium]|nr:hypothetical protein [Desulfobacterales bacterium]